MIILLLWLQEFTHHIFSFSVPFFWPQISYWIATLIPWCIGIVVGNKPKDADLEQHFHCHISDFGDWGQDNRHNSVITILVSGTCKFSYSILFFLDCKSRGTSRWNTCHVSNLNDELWFISDMARCVTWYGCHCPTEWIIYLRKFVDFNG